MAPTAAQQVSPSGPDRRPWVALALALVLLAALSVAFPLWRWVTGALLLLAVVRSLGMVLAARAALRDPDARAKEKRA